MQKLWGGFYRGRLCQLSQYQGRFHTYCGNLHRYGGGGGELIKLNIYLKKKPQTFLELDLFADTGICHKWWLNFHLLFQKKIHFIPDSQGVIAKELSLVRALQIHPALQYSDEISLHYYYYYYYCHCYNCYYCYICASIDCIFIRIGILVLVLVLELGIECWLWGSLSFLYTQFLSYLVLKEVKEVCLDLSNRQAAEFFLFTLRGDWRTFALRLSFLHMRGQWLWEGFVACLWLLKASLARWRKLPFRSGWMWEKTSNNEDQLNLRLWVTSINHSTLNKQGGHSLFTVPFAYFSCSVSVIAPTCLLSSWKWVFFKVGLILGW